VGVDVSVSASGTVDDLLDALAVVDHATVEAGILAPEGGRTYADSGATVAEVAMWQEFGTRSSDGRRHVPARPFMRRAIAEDGGAWGEPIFDAVVDRRVSERRMEAALVDVARDAARSIHRSLQTTQQWSLPLAESTVKRKGHRWQLHETLQLSYSVSALATRRGRKIGTKVRV